MLFLKKMLNFWAIFCWIFLNFTLFISPDYLIFWKKIIKKNNIIFKKIKTAVFPVKRCNQGEKRIKNSHFLLFFAKIYKICAKFRKIVQNFAKFCTFFCIFSQFFIMVYPGLPKLPFIKWAFAGRKSWGDPELLEVPPECTIIFKIKGRSPREVPRKG